MANNLLELTGPIERIIFRKEQFHIFRLKNSVTAQGNFAQLAAGETLRLYGTYHTHRTHGQYFEVQPYERQKPS